ncbi:hypothetical protein ACQ4PT_026519 [Festuca glaucescens]
MKNTKLVAILVLQAVLVMGMLAHVNAEFPKCCNSCRFFSGAVVCDDAGPQCREGCVNCAWCRRPLPGRFGAPTRAATTARHACPATSNDRRSKRPENKSSDETMR